MLVLLKGQRQLAVRDPVGRCGKLVAKRHRQSDGTPIATGPPPGVRAKTVETRQEIVGHANVAVPHIIELDVPDDRPEPLEAFTYVSAQAVAALHGYQHVPTRDETIACIVAREIEFAVSVRRSEERRVGKECV